MTDKEASSDLPNIMWLVDGRPGLKYALDSKSRALSATDGAPTESSARKLNKLWASLRRKDS